MRRNLQKLLLVFALFYAACGSPKRAAVVDLGNREDLSQFTLGSLRGSRDGDRLQAQAMFSDSSSILTLDLRFAIGSPTRLETGTWSWSIRAPSIGGVFDLLDPGGVARYRATLPVTELKPLPRKL